MAYQFNPFTEKFDKVFLNKPETDPIFNAWLSTQPFNNYVPYLGATQDVDLGEFNLINYVKMTYDPVIGAYLTE